MTDEQVIRATNILRKYNITPQYNILTGNPYETAEDMQQRIKLLLKIQRPYNLNIFSLINFPKTDLSKRLIRDNLLESNESKALTQWRKSFKFKRNKNHLYYSCLVSLLSKSFVPKGMVKFF